MAMENFLVNPPRKKPKSMAGMKRHRILAFEGKNGGLFTSTEAKIVRKGIKINPFKFKKNPLGEELMFVGLNPRKGVKSMAKRTHKRKYKKNPAKRRYRRNPMSGMKDMVPMVISGGAGALVGRAVPQFIPVLKNMGMLGNIVSKIGLAIGGAMILDKTLGKKFKGIEDGWVIGSLASAVADLSSLGIVKGMQGLGMIADDTLVEYPADGLGMYSELSGIDNPYADTEGTFTEEAVY